MFINEVPNVDADTLTDTTRQHVLKNKQSLFNMFEVIYLFKWAVYIQRIEILPNKHVTKNRIGLHQMNSKCSYMHLQPFLCFILAINLV